MIVVTGGAGYIGSHIVRALRQHGREVLVVDDFRTGHRDTLGGVNCIEADIAEARPDWNGVQGVIHTAGSSLVSESVENPDLYRQNNVEAGIKFLAPAVKRGIPIVYSSTAAVYGEPEQVPISEDHPVRPINPYGETKLELEQWLRSETDVCAIFRYFNAAGGVERHNPETHLIPLLRTGSGPFSVFGNDYPTPDGTCIRDFVHVDDLARAHLLALGKNGLWNLGCGKGISVLEVVLAAGREPKFEKRRPGDPAVLVADITRAKQDLGWSPEKSLKQMLL